MSAIVHLHITPPIVEQLKPIPGFEPIMRELQLRHEEKQRKNFEDLMQVLSSSNMIKSPPVSRRDRILKKVLDNCVETENGCLIWQGGHSGNGRGGGYGRICIDGATVATHRLVYVHFNGIIPPKKQVDHTCGNRLCCNPNHLELVTHKENQKRRSLRMKGTD